MSLVKTLAKVAIGVAVAKGASKMIRGAQAGQPTGAGGGLGGLLGGLAGGGGSNPFGGANSPAGGGLQDMMGSILGGAQGGSAGGLPGGLGGLLEQLGGGQAAGRSGGGLQDILGGLAGAGGAGGILGGLAGALGGGTHAQNNNRNFGDVLNSQFDQNNEPEIQPTADQEAAAGLMLRAMIQATKADGQLDEAEKGKLIEQLGGNVDSAEAQFVQSELARPVDVDGLARETPKGMEQQIYAMSVLGIDLDSQAEAQYLHKLAQALSLNPELVNAIHGQLGVPSLYT